MSKIIRSTRGQSLKEPASRKGSGMAGSGMAHLLSALHQNAAAVVNSKSQLNGPDQILTAETYATNRRNGCVKLRKEEHGLGSEEPISIPTMLRDISEAYPDTIALKVKREGGWKCWSYEDYLEEVCVVARAFIHLGLHRHHSVAIIGMNSPEWVISDLAAIFAGGISVGMYRELSSEDIAKIAIDAKADIIVVDNEALLKRILLVQHKLPELKAIVQFRGEPPLSDKRRLHRSHKKHILSWEQLIEIGQELPESRLEDRMKRIAINHCCTLVYTSGPAAGPPKGVMLSHDNLTWCSKMLLGFIRAPGFNRLPSPGEEMILSLLPNSCVSSQTIDIYYSMSIAGTLCFYDEDTLNNSDSFFEALAEVQPTVLFGTPAVYEMIYHRFRDVRRHMSGLQKLFLDWSNSTVRSKHVKGRVPNAADSSSKLSKWQTAMAKNTVCKRRKEALGFGPRTVFLSGGDPMSTEIVKFLAGYDIVVHESFGQPENCGLLSANIPKRYCKLGTSGKMIPGVKTKVTPAKDEDAIPDILNNAEEEGAKKAGKITCWGRNIFMGYLNKELDTKEVMTEEEWLDLGHLGQYDNDDFLTVHGRADSFIKLTTGEVVFPHKVEQLVRMELPCVKHAMLVGDQEQYLAVLLVLDTLVDQATQTPGNELTEDAQRWFRHARFDVRTVAEVVESMEKGLKHVIQAGIDRANQSHLMTTSPNIGDWRLVPSKFSYQTGELALNGELNRAAAKENNLGCIRSLYVHSGAVCDSVPCKLQLQHNSVLQHLTQIKEEDESKTSSRNSIDRLNKESSTPTLTKIDDSNLDEEDETSEVERNSDSVDSSAESAADADDDEVHADESAAVILDPVEPQVKVISTTEDNTTHIIVKDPSLSSKSASSVDSSGSSRASVTMIIANNNNEVDIHGDIVKAKITRT